MCKKLITLLVSCFLFQSYAFADHHKSEEGSDFARYSVSMAGSLFGPSGNFQYNASKKTSYVFAMGIFSGAAPFDPEVNGISYTASGSTNWVGGFINHRPLDGAEWFRIIAGIGIGNIQNDLEDSAGNAYAVNYTENPVGYLGIGFGAEAKKGFIWGFDLGLLHTARPMIQKVAGTGDDETSQLADSWMFGGLLPNIQLSLGWGF